MARTYQDDEDGSGPQWVTPSVPTVTRRLLWIQIAIGLLVLIFARIGATSALIDWPYERLGLDVAAWRRVPWIPVWQVVTYGFLHSASDPLHLMFNMLGLYFFGSMLERLIGARRFLTFFLCALAVGGGAQLALALATGQSPFVVGASGAIMFLVVAMAVLRPSMTILLMFVPARLWVVAVIYVALDLLGLLGGGGDTAYMVHLGGAGFGFAAVKLGWLWFDPVQAWETHKAVKQVEDLRSDEERLDQLLGRIHKEGIGSLSKGEREFLKRMSARRGG